MQGRAEPIVIDLNADLGEGFAFDAALMPLLSSCNIACGGHHGDRATMRETVALARAHGVHVGAHPSYPDRAHFGRRVVDLDRGALREALARQLGDFAAVCDAAGVEIHHIKPHGALYHQVSADPATAEVMMEALGPFLDAPTRPALYLPEGSVLAKLAAEHFPIHWEGFLDRRYRSDGSLVPRDEADAVISDPEASVAQFSDMVLRRQIQTVGGEVIPCRASTFCVHGDTPGAVRILIAIHERLDELGILLHRGHPDVGRG